MRKIVLAIVLLSIASSAHAQVGRNRANYRTCSNVVPVCINNNTSLDFHGKKSA